MSMQQIVLKNQSQNILSINRMLGVVAMVSSPLLYLGIVFFAPDSAGANPSKIFAMLGGISYLAGAMAGATAMRNLRVTGSGTSAKILYVVQMIGLFLAMCFDVIENAAPNLRETWAGFITDMAYPFSHLLMIVVGIAIVRAKIWRGWRTIPAFLAGLGLPLFIILSLFVGRENAFYTFPLLTIAGFFGLGLAVYLTKIECLDGSVK